MSSATEPTARHDQSQNPAEAPANGFTPLGPLAGTGARPRALPSRGAGGGRAWPFALGGLFLLALIAGVSWYAFFRPAATRADVLLHPVKKEQLVVTVAEKGTVESADNRDIVCKVRAGTKGYSTTINWVIEDGARVKAGQLLMILDDSALKDQEEEQQIKVQTAFANKVKADKDYEIAVKQNQKDIATAESDLTTKTNALNNYTGLTYDPSRAALAAVGGGPVSLSEGGTFRQSVDDLLGQVRKAEADVEQNREYAAWTNNMVKLTYMPATQAQAAKNRLDASVETHRSLKAKLKQLLESDRDQNLTKLILDRDIARITLDQVTLAAEANLAKALAEKQRANSEYAQQDERLRDLTQQRAECKIYAPKDIEPNSMVVYFKNESSRFGSSSNQGMIEQGAQVKEGQKMLRIPNLRRMQVNTKVHEAMVARLRGDVRVPTYFVDGLQKLMMLNTDPFSRVVGQRQEVVDGIRQQFRNFEYKKVSDGQKAMIRVDALGGRQFEGHVRTVAQIASQADSWMSDVKLFPTLVLIDHELLPDGSKRAIDGEEIRPDMTAEVTITVDTAKEPVLTVPVQAVIGGTELGRQREVFVKTPTGYERRPVTLGLFNEKVVEIRDGLAEGDEVVINPKVLLGDDKTRTREAGEGKGSKNGEGKGEGYQKGDLPPKGDMPPVGPATPPKGDGTPTSPTGPKKGKKFGGAGGVPGGGGGIPGGGGGPPQE